MITGLHHVQLGLPAGGEDAARAFYAGLLGLPEVAKPTALAGRGGVWFRCGAAELHLGVEDPFWAAPKAHPGLVVDDLDAAVATLAAAGIRAVADVPLPAGRRVHVRDPFGNRLELLELAEPAAQAERRRP